jgi:hypothetical protein
MSFFIMLSIIIKFGVPYAERMCSAGETLVDPQGPVGLRYG